MITELLREDRLGLWDLLIRGEQISQSEVRETIAKLAHDAPQEERASCILLLAAAGISEDGSKAMQRNLVAGLRYWFSYVGTKSSTDAIKTLLSQQKWRNMDLITCMGLYLSWSEAMHSVGANGDDYAALNRLKTILKNRYSKEWEKAFGRSVPFTLSHGR